MNRCPTTGKVPYRSKKAAERAFRVAVANSDQHAYRCPDRPSHWHLGHGSHQPQPGPVSLSTTSSKQRWNTQQWDAATMLLWGRCRDACDWCGKPLAGNLERHHRQVRAIGGDRLANLVALHTACHKYVHAHPEEARERGAIVSRHATDPAAVPLLLPDGRQVLLTDDGGLLAA